MSMTLWKKEFLKLFMWVGLVLLLHYTAIVIGQVLTSFVFCAQDMLDGIITYTESGEILYNGEALLKSEAYMARYGYGTTPYATILALPQVIIGIFIFGKSQKKPFTQNFPVNKMPISTSILGLIIGFSIYFPTAFIVSNTFLKNLSGEVNEATLLLYEQTPFWLLFFSTVICAPIMEELIFRGFIYAQLEDVTKVWAADLDAAYEEKKLDLPGDDRGQLQARVMKGHLIIAKRRLYGYVIVFQALLFGAVHMNLQQFVYATALGLLFGMMRYYTKSIWPGLLAHIGFNAFSVMQYGMLKHEDWAVTKTWMETSDNTKLIIAVIVFAVALLLFEIIVKNPKKSSGKTSQNP